jgi:hypothetical protein
MVSRSGWGRSPFPRNSKDPEAQFPRHKKIFSTFSVGIEKALARQRVVFVGDLEEYP